MIGPRSFDRQLRQSDFFGICPGFPCLQRSSGSFYLGAAGQHGLPYDYVASINGAAAAE